MSKNVLLTFSNVGAEKIVDRRIELVYTNYSETNLPYPVVKLNRRQNQLFHDISIFHFAGPLPGGMRANFFVKQNPALDAGFEKGFCR